MSLVRILTIEDNDADTDLLRYGLDQQGQDYELEVLCTGEEALQFVREHRSGIRKPEPCVVLLDLQLPRYDGIAILRAIREAPALEHLHVIVLTSVATPAQAQEIAAMGAMYRKKPSELSAVVELAAEIIAICNNSARVAAV